MSIKDLPDDEDIPSRTALKRVAQEAKDFGHRLTGLNTAQLVALDLPAALHEAITDYQRFTSHGARRRQLLLIGKLLRAEDEAAIRARLAGLLREDAESIYRHHQAETWRDRLVADDESLAHYLLEHPEADQDALRTILARIRSSRDETQVRSNKRVLFRLLRQQP